jgi:hypothetical protein
MNDKQNSEPCPYIQNGRDGTHWCALAERPADHREVMRMALEYVSWHAHGECRVGTGPIPAPNDVVAALRAALGEGR